jgi:hypothetical protein
MLIYAKTEKEDVSAVEVAEAMNALQQELEILKRGLAADAEPESGTTE